MQVGAPKIFKGQFLEIYRTKIFFSRPKVLFNISLAKNVIGLRRSQNDEKSSFGWGPYNFFLILRNSVEI